MRTLNVTMLFHHEKLRDFVVGIFIDRVMNHKIPPLLALTVADTHSLSTLQGAAYYTQLLDLEQVTSTRETSSHAMRFGDHNGFTQDQFAHLLHGHWALVHLWDDLRNNPVAASCTCNRRGCSDIWYNAWLHRCKRTWSNTHSADVLGKLRKIRTYLRSDGITDSMSEPCQKASLSALAEKIIDLQDSLIDYFDFTRPTTGVMDEEQTE